MMFTYLKLSMFASSTGQNGQVKYYHLSYCDKVYSRGNINQKHRIGDVMVSVLASSAVDRGFVIVIDSSFVEQVEEYTRLNTDSSEILVSNII
jgi:hypothetical protein